MGQLKNVREGTTVSLTTDIAGRTNQLLNTVIQALRVVGTA